MSNIKEFESNLLKEFSSRTRLTQKLSLKTCRSFSSQILTMFNDGYTPAQTAVWVISQIDVNKIKDEEFLPRSKYGH